MRYIDLKRDAVGRLLAAGIPDADIDVQLMLIASAGMERSMLFAAIFEEVPDKVRNSFEIMLSRRLNREPLQYILGSQEFMGLDFIVNSDVLIPRQDTELLAEKGIEEVKRLIEISMSNRNGEDEKIDVLDLCTGSGCVAVSVAKAVDNLLCEYAATGHFCKAEVRVTGADISEGAVKVAEKNRQINKTEHVTVSILNSDLFKEIKGRFNVITANPPYVKAGNIELLMPEVNEFEPRLALDGGTDGLVFYRRIIEEAPEYLKRDGRLIFEMDDDQGEAVSELLIKGGFTEVKVFKDLTGADRVAFGIFKG